MEEFMNLLKGRSRTALMGFAVLWIILFHFAMYGNLLRFPAVDFLLGTGYLGVDIFFFLSAYGLCFSLNSHSVKDFYKRRVQRLFPVYLIFLAVLFLLFPDTRGHAWILTLLYQITGVSMLVKLDIEWFVPALILVYAFFPLLFKGIQAIYKKGFWAVSLMVSTLSLLCPLLSRCVFYLFAYRLVIITLGVITYLALQERNRTTLLGIYTLCAFIGILYIGDSRVNVGLTGSLIIPILLYGLSQLSACIGRLRILPFIGEHSLEIYLAQCLAFNHFMASGTLNFVPATLISFSMIPLGAAFFHYSSKALCQPFNHVSH